MKRTDSIRGLGAVAVAAVAVPAFGHHTFPATY